MASMAPLGLHRDGNKQLVVAAVALALATLLAYAPAAGGHYVSLDDDAYIASNAMVQRGISLDGVLWAFTTNECQNWHPLTWISYMLDCTLFGPGPLAPHLENIALHAVDAVL